MADGHSLAWHHKLEQRETAAGFASRLAALHGRSMGPFLRDMGIHPRSIDKGEPKAVRHLANLGAADADKLLRYTASPTPDGKFQCVAEETFNRLSVARTYFRYCPRCVMEDMANFQGPAAARPWLRFEWTVTHVRSCPTHRLLLLDAEPRRRQFESFDFCETIAERLPEIQHEARETGDMSTSPLRDWLVGRVDGGRPSALADEEMYVVLSASETIGLSALHPPKVQTSKLPPRQWAEAADEGFSILSGGEKSITNLLERLNANQRDTRGVIGLRDTYGQFYGLLQKTIEDPAYGRLRDIVRDFAVATLPIPAGTDVLGVTLDKQHIHTIHTAADLAGVRPLTIRNALARKGVDVAGKKDHRVLIKADEIQSLIGQLNGALSTSDVLELTGIPLMHLRVLIAAGHLPTVTASTEKAYAKHRFTRAAVDNMMEAFWSGAVTVDKPSDRQMSITDARHVAGGTLETVFAAILEKRLLWKGLLAGQRSYSALLVDAVEVTAMVRTGPARANFTKEEVREFIPGLGRDAVEKLIRAGHLSVIEEFSNEARRKIPVISRDSAEAFRKKYVALGELCQRSHLHHKRVTKILRENGVREALNANYFNNFFYNRSDLTHIL